MSDWLRRQWFLVGMGLCLLAAALAGPALAPWTSRIPVTWLAAATMLLIAMGLPASALVRALQRPGPVLLSLLISYGIAPLLADAAGVLIRPEFRLGLVIAATVPCTLASAVIWTRLAGGNEAVALLVTIASNLLVFLVAPAWLSALAKATVTIESGPIMQTLLAFVVVPILIGQALRRPTAILTLAERYKSVLRDLCQLLILLIIFKSAVQASTQFEGISITQVAWVAAVCVLVHGLLLLLGFRLAVLLFGRPEAIAVAFAGSQKTLQVGALLLERHFASEPLAIVPILAFHVGQLLFDTWVISVFLAAGRRQQEASPADVPGR